MDIDFNLVIYIVVGTFLLCVCCTYACYRGEKRRQARHEAAAEALRASATPVEVVEAVIVINT